MKQETKKMIKKITNGLMFAGKLVGCTLVGAYCLKDARITPNMSFDSSNYGYSDAVQAIMKSDMWDNDKSKAVTILPKDASSELYKSVISVVRSDIWSSNKVAVIRNMCQTK